MKSSIKPWIVASIAAALLVGTFAWSQEENEHESGARRTAPVGKVTPWQAMKLAEGKTGGKAMQATFEFEDGHWIYGVIVVGKGKLSEAEIDATTGKFGDVEQITPSEEAKELEGDLNRAMKGG